MAEQKNKFRRKEEDEDEEKIRIAKTPTEKQRLRLEKLLKNIDKPVSIPNPKKEYKPQPPPEFVRNVVGSSAGAGSGEYHIYRNLRKKEYARQQFYDEQTKTEQLDKAFQEKLEANKQKSEGKTAKKRLKRLKRKEKLKTSKKLKTNLEPVSSDESENSDKDGEDSNPSNKAPSPALVENADDNGEHCNISNIAPPPSIAEDAN